MFRDLRDASVNGLILSSTLFFHTELLEMRQTTARTRSCKGLVTVQGGVALKEPSG